MSYALETGKEQSPAQAAGIAVSDLWLIPLLLLALMVDRFARHLGKLKAMRRTRPLPRDWQGFYPGLRRCEWAIHSLTVDGVRQILLGEDLDLAALSNDPEPPDDFQPAMPRSALSMHRRMEDIARFHADPERFIRRHAARIAARDDDDDFRRPHPAIPAATTIFRIPRPASTTTTIFQNAASDGPIAAPIRGPPWLIPTADCLRPTASLNQRDRAPNVPINSRTQSTH
jgi:hypothetical protein